MYCKLCNVYFLRETSGCIVFANDHFDPHRFSPFWILFHMLSLSINRILFLLHITLFVLFAFLSAVCAFNCLYSEKWKVIVQCLRRLYAVLNVVQDANGWSWKLIYYNTGLITGLVIQCDFWGRLPTVRAMTYEKIEIQLQHKILRCRKHRQWKSIARVLIMFLIPN